MNTFYFTALHDYSEFNNTTFGNNVLNLKSLFLITEWKYVTSFEKTLNSFIRNILCNWNTVNGA